MSVLLFPVEAGTRGLHRELLLHLVQSRYAAASASSPDCALRSLAQLHEAVGHASAPTVEHAVEGLSALEGLGLVETIPDATGLTTWRATAEGVRAIDRTHEHAEMRAAA